MCLFDKEHLAEHRLENGVIDGYEYEIVSNGHGYRCGYIKVEPGHPWFAQDYKNLVSVDAHGGLTYASFGSACPGEHDDKAEWWVGFDCAHLGDQVDASIMTPDEAAQIRAVIPDYFDHAWRGSIKGNDYVRHQCEALALQAACALVEQGSVQFLGKATPVSTE